VDYVGDLEQFEKEFSDDLASSPSPCAATACRQLKISVHSAATNSRPMGPSAAPGPVRRGLHIKTAGPPGWRKSSALAEAGGDGLELAKEIYAGALEHVEELCAPYATVIDIDPQKTKSAHRQRLDLGQFVSALRHNPREPAYNPHLRQLLHVGYKIAAKMGNRYLEALKRHEAVVARNVTENLFERHLKPLFLGRA
jgi:hypothetical protein